MELDKYQIGCARTFSKELSPHEKVLSFGMGLMGEAGEIADEIKKVLFHGHPVGDSLRKEFGDQWWYIASSALMHAVDLSYLMGAKTFEEIDELFADEPTEDRVEILQKCAELTKCAAEAARASEELWREKTLWKQQRFEGALLNCALAVLWLGIEFGINHTQVTEENLQKLLERYPDGFSSEASQQNRGALKVIK